MYEEQKTEPSRIRFANEIEMTFKLKGIPSQKYLKKGSILFIDDDGLVSHESDESTKLAIVVLEDTNVSSNIGVRINVRCIVNGNVDINFVKFVDENFNIDETPVNYEDNAIYLAVYGLYLVQSV